MAGSTLLVAAANGYLGRQALLHFCQRGYEIIASCRERDHAELALFLDRNGCAIEIITADLARDPEVEALVSSVQERWGGRIDALLNAGGAFEMASTTAATEAQARGLWESNFLASFLLLRRVLPVQISQGFGRAVTVSAAATLSPAGRGMGLYIGAKSALNALVQSTAAELGERDVRVNAVLPTTIDTPRNRQEIPKADFSRWVTAEKLLGVIERLLSREAKEQGALIRVE